MKLLKDILYKCRLTEAIGPMDITIEHITADSREVKGGTLFVAVKGTQVDGHKYIESAIKSGAIAIICEELPSDRPEQITFVQVDDSAKSLGFIAANFYDNPSKEVQVVAVTGTNGKTTTVTLLYQLFRLMNKKTGLLSTVVNRINDTEVVATHTTPDAISLNRMLRDMADQGIEFCFMEASSHAIHQHRVTGVEFAGGVFTNITRDHLDYHKTFNDYIKAKKGLFDMLPSGSFALVNNDDNHAEIMLQNCRGCHLSYGLRTMSDYRAKILENQFSGLHININGKDLYTKLIGGFNAYNLLAVYAVAMELDQDEMDTLTNMSMLGNVDGRFQYLKGKNEVTAIVDYAHTPDALKNVLATIKDIRTGNEQVITVVGCGGDRDKGKRPLMARISSELSDRVILTSDNPRSENPDQIITDMKEGLDPVQLSKTFSITDRKEAIRLACSIAQKGDIILVAGKGHEKYQEIKGERFPFDDLQVVNESLNTPA
ncbi:MAG: UDP-N-acetylmuramoyl-L-alanyl-D-glutamate--2,6-diaminopimelate ligase [Flavobacteriales bacterium]|nr:UDP-N-acetylmuramoyl-L-alanyl-D-glutamate--2,6-diaminopimelate ligase [Flavobacteriales bacterium]